MSDPVTPRSALWSFSDDERPAGGEFGVEVVEHAFQGFFNLRCDAYEDAISQGIIEVLGSRLPLQANTVVYSQAAVYWLGPDEWLLRTPSEEDGGLAKRLSARLEGQWFALTDISGGMTHLTVSGAHAESVLRQGTTVDLHPRAFGQGRCAQTLIAKTNALIARPNGDGEAFDVLVRRSFADYLLLFLRDAANDYGFRFTRS
jgi:sarcosine oxidase subunit gamma